MHRVLPGADNPATQSTEGLQSGLDPRQLPLANRIVRRTLEIIHYLRPCRWFMENPRTGLLKAQTFMGKHQFVDADYCQFADWGYQKPTRVWFGTCDNPLHRKRALTNRLCPGCQHCPNMVGKRHRVHLSSPRVIV